MRGSIPLLFLGFFLFGGATAAGLQARYAAVDLAPVALRGRHLSLIVWATTLGASRRTQPRSSCGRISCRIRRAQDVRARRQQMLAGRGCALRCERSFRRRRLAWA